jgi:hypothetical protein
MHKGTKHSRYSSSFSLVCGKESDFFEQINFSVLFCLLNSARRFENLNNGILAFLLIKVLSSGNSMNVLLNN